MLRSGAHAASVGGDRHDDAVIAVTPFALGARVAQRLVSVVCTAPADTPSSARVAVRTRDECRRQRRIEFDTGRACAARLLAGLGCADPTVSVASDRSPIWPSGFVGSIAHTDEWLGVAVARRLDVRSLGIDLEAIVTEAAADDLEVVCLNHHEIGLRAASGMDRVLFVSICFSAKEALYKCLYPLVGQYFDFSDAQIECVDIADGLLRIRLLRDLSNEFCAGACLEGSYRRDGSHVFTAFEVQPERSASCTR